MTMPERSSSTRRLVLTEVGNRAANERIVPAPEAGWDLGLVERHCECGNAACRATLRLTVAEYEELRQDARRFAVVHEHVIERVERLVERRQRYSVVEKVAGAGELAEAHDPRS